MSGVGIDICRLCLKNSELRNSHILPEFLHEDLYDEKHRTLLISHEKEIVVQKGVREKLLCQKCETKLSVYENYAKGIIYEIPNFSRDINLELLYSDSVNYDRLKLFQLSILWRAGISSNVIFQQVKLGPHEESIRSMLNEGNPGKVSDYGCLMLITLDTEILHTIIQSPTRFTKKLDGHNAYKFPTGNLEWVFLVTSHAINPRMQQLFLQENGYLRIILSRFDEQSQLIKIAQTLRRIEGKQ
jgi:hypothetical protein